MDQVLEVDAVTGEAITRAFTADEIGQREADAIVAAAEEAERQAQAAAREAARVSARARLASQGWTDAEIDVTYPTLVASS